MFTLSFEVTFSYDLDTVYIANSFVYTFSDLVRYLDKIEGREMVRRQQIGRTIAGNPIEMLIITNFNSTPEQLAEREAIFLSARIHPSESGSSLIIEGMMDELVAQNRKSEFLRNNFIFKIVPMLNPDGVINGNSRTGLNGLDLNR